MRPTALENVTDHWQGVRSAAELEFDRQHQIDQLADPRVHLQRLGREQLFCSPGNVEANRREGALPAMLAVSLKRKSTSRA